MYIYLSWAVVSGLACVNMASGNWPTERPAFLQRRSVYLLNPGGFALQQAMAQRPGILGINPMCPMHLCGETPRAACENPVRLWSRPEGQPYKHKTHDTGSTGWPPACHTGHQLEPSPGCRLSRGRAPSLALNESDPRPRRELAVSCARAPGASGCRRGPGRLRQSQPVACCLCPAPSWSGLSSSPSSSSSSPSPLPSPSSSCSSSSSSS